MSEDSHQMFTDRMRQARVGLLAAATVAAMVAMMLPGAAPEERVLKERVEPVYPDLARRMGITGMVKLALIVDCVGTVVRVKTLSGDSMLAAAAGEAARHWRFTSGAGEARVPVEFNFPVTS
jgi:TonB family protein